MKHKFIALQMEKFPRHQKGNCLTAYLHDTIKIDFRNLARHDNTILFSRRIQQILLQINALAAMSEMPEKSNLSILTGPNHLGRPLPNRYREDDLYVLLNHIAIADLYVLSKTLIHIGSALSDAELMPVMQFFRDKTLESLGSRATCFTAVLRDATAGLLWHEPELAAFFEPTRTLRREFYQFRKKEISEQVFTERLPFLLREIYPEETHRQEDYFLILLDRAKWGLWDFGD